ncbi:hypothetical protein EBBID32_10280 [Sphingobium indicum BiD32]|uniref:Uncharacterized protein n=1 Tax=Sphingobium indicum BiD32 TaxID=1301087 RepID=N1MHM0_9SPHN|nr:hypothetical protein EBBID32_10280 [Sphingobium indicum BiD32]
MARTRDVIRPQVQADDWKRQNDRACGGYGPSGDLGAPLALLRRAAACRSPSPTLSIARQRIGAPTGRRAPGHLHCFAHIRPRFAVERIGA